MFCAQGKIFLSHENSKNQIHQNLDLLKKDTKPLGKEEIGNDSKEIYLTSSYSSLFQLRKGKIMCQ